MMKFTRRNMLRMLGGGLASSVGVGWYTWKIEPHWIEWVHRALPLAGLPRSLHGRTLVQLSDIHIGPRVDDEYLKRAFQQVADFEPDVLVYTGDLVSYTTSVRDHIRAMFPHLPHGKLATLGVLGNHDYGKRWAQPEIAADIVHVAAECGITILRNESVEIRGLRVVGLDDLWARKFDPQSAFARVPHDAPTIALSHNPDTADLPGWGAFRGWILAGHTHGGQCKPPFLPPPELPVKNRRYTAGAFTTPGNSRMYINRGLGHLLQVRFNARPEITVFRLETQDPAEG